MLVNFIQLVIRMKERKLMKDKTLRSIEYGKTIPHSFVFYVVVSYQS